MRMTTNLAIMAGATLVAVSPALAEGATISNVTVSQHWPWDKKVEIRYEMSAVAAPQDVLVSLKDGENSLSVDESAFSGEFRDIMGGEHVIVFDPSKTAYANRNQFSSLRVALQAIPARRYMIVDLDSSLANTAEARVSYTNVVVGSGTDAAGGRAWDDEYKTSKLVLRRCPAGTFRAGSPTNAYGRWLAGGAEPLQNVRISKAFYIGVFEFTQRQMELVRGTKAWSWHTNIAHYATRPVDNIYHGHLDDGYKNWPTSLLIQGGFLKSMRDKCGGSIQFHVPTEAEWEYAARAGSTNELYNAETTVTTYETFKTLAKQIGNVLRGSNTAEANRNVAPDDGGTKPVGMYIPNAWGLYDVIGNVCEWTRDYWSSGFGYKNEEWLVNPYPPSRDDNLFCYRGGAYSHQTSGDNASYSAALGRLSGKYRQSGYAAVSPIASGSIGFRIWAPDQPEPAVAGDLQYTDGVMVSIAENYVYPMVRDASAQLAWEPVDFWGTNIAVAATEVSIGGASVRLGASAVASAWQFAAPDEDVVETAVLSYLDAGGNVCRAVTNELVLLHGALAGGQSSVMTATNAAGWRSFRSKAQPIAYSPDWVPFGVTNGAPGSFSIEQGERSVVASIPPHPGWRVLHPEDEPWSGPRFDVGFAFPDSAFENAWFANIRRGGGFILMFQ